MFQTTMFAGEVTITKVEEPMFCVSCMSNGDNMDGLQVDGEINLSGATQEELKQLKADMCIAASNEINRIFEQYPITD